MLLECIVHSSIWAAFVTIGVLWERQLEYISGSTLPEVLNLLEGYRRYITNVTFSFQTLTYSLLVTTYIMRFASPFEENGKKLRRWLDYAFTTIVLPYSLVVSLCFWTYYHIDRELMYSNKLDAWIPSYLNHGVHTVNSLLPLMDSLLTRRELSSLTVSAAGVMSYGALITLLLLDTRLRYGSFQYKFMDDFTALQFCFFVMSCAIVAMAGHIACRFICKWKSGYSRAETSLVERKNL